MLCQRTRKSEPVVHAVQGIPDDLIRRIAHSPARGRITWLGRVAHDEVPRLLAEHGILLLTSRYEASPTVVKEALRSMRPVVSTDVGDVADWLDRGRADAQ